MVRFFLLYGCVRRLVLLKLSLISFSLGESWLLCALRSIFWCVHFRFSWLLRCKDVVGWKSTSLFVVSLDFGSLFSVRVVFLF